MVSNRPSVQSNISKNPSITAIEEFFAVQHYVPENMAICISGNIDPDRTIEIIEKYFSSWKNSGSTPTRTEVGGETLKGREFVQVQYLGEEQVLSALDRSQISLQIIQPFAWLI